uniref:EF-hand calcium-binding domain-containing protein 4B-like isoform X1 n=1 Tax=Myxine glutinosa TaxID=7769 RepID=UPI00358E1818
MTLYFSPRGLEEETPTEDKVATKVRMDSLESPTRVANYSSDPDLMREKVRGLFALCDHEEKGFITKRDLQRLQEEVSLSPEQLEVVFEKLDTNRNGYITLAEFALGLGKIAGTPRDAFNLDRYTSLASGTACWNDDWMDKANVVSTAEEETHFNEVMDNLGVSHAFKNEYEVCELWLHLQRDDPTLLKNFENLLAKMSHKISEAKQEQKKAEQALRVKDSEHGKEVQQLYNELEQQIHMENERLTKQKDIKKHLYRSGELEKELETKELEVANIRQVQLQQLKTQLEELNSESARVKEQNESLQEVNSELEMQLMDMRRELDCAQQFLQQRNREEIANSLKQPQMETALEVTHPTEQDNSLLLTQLEFFREMNNYMRDKRDADGIRTSYWKYQHQCPSQEVRTPPLQRDGSVIGEYIEDDNPTSRLSLCSQDTQCPRTDGTAGPVPGGTRMLQGRNKPNEWEPPVQNAAASPNRRAQLSPQPDRGGRSSSRGQTAGTESGGPQNFPPDRLFKVVLVGESGVGKSCFIQQLCHKRFSSTICATIGVDYHVKSLMLDNVRIALQLWDTAGQERFRSITKQYFRRADGVLVMYDVTNEFTFRAVRNWMISVKERVEDDVTIFLLGNKTDAIKAEGRNVSSSNAKRLAKEYHAVFYECSAKQADNVEELILHMARLLAEQEDKQKEKLLKLQQKDDISAKNCCL